MLFIPVVLRYPEQVPIKTFGYVNVPQEKNPVWYPTKIFPLEKGIVKPEHEPKKTLPSPFPRLIPAEFPTKTFSTEPVDAFPDSCPTKTFF